MADFLFTFAWIILWSIPSFLIQLILCFKINKRYIKFLPLAISVAGYILILDGWFNFSGLHHGWHELAAFITGVYTSLYTLGVTTAWLVYYIVKRKKR